MRQNLRLTKTCVTITLLSKGENAYDNEGVYPEHYSNKGFISIV